MGINPRRGEIWDVNFSPQEGQEIKDPHPAVVINENRIIGYKNLRIVVPITSWKQRHDDLFHMVQLKADASTKLDWVSSADSSQVKSVDIGRFIKKRGNVGSAIMEDIVSAVAIIIGA